MYSIAPEYDRTAAVTRVRARIVGDPHFFFAEDMSTSPRAYLLRAKTKIQRSPSGWGWLGIPGALLLEQGEHRRSNDTNNMGYCFRCCCTGQGT